MSDFSEKEILKGLKTGDEFTPTKFSAGDNNVTGGKNN